MTWDLTFDDEGNLEVKEEPRLQEFGSALYKMMDSCLDQQLVQDILQGAVKSYWEENCEGEPPPNLEIVDVKENGDIVFVVHEDEPCFTIPI